MSAADLPLPDAVGNDENEIADGGVDSRPPESSDGAHDLKVELTTNVIDSEGTLSQEQACTNLLTSSFYNTYLPSFSPLQGHYPCLSCPIFPN